MMITLTLKRIIALSLIICCTIFISCASMFYNPKSFYLYEFSSEQNDYLIDKNVAIFNTGLKSRILIECLGKSTLSRILDENKRIDVIDFVPTYTVSGNLFSIATHVPSLEDSIAFKIFDCFEQASPLEMEVYFDSKLYTKPSFINKLNKIGRFTPRTGSIFMRHTYNFYLESNKSNDEVLTEIEFIEAEASRLMGFERKHNTSTWEEISSLCDTILSFESNSIDYDYHFYQLPQYTVKIPILEHFNIIDTYHCSSSANRYYIKFDNGIKMFIRQQLNTEDNNEEQNEDSCQYIDNEYEKSFNEQGICDWRIIWADRSFSGGGMKNEKFWYRLNYRNGIEIIAIDCPEIVYECQFLIENIIVAKQSKQ